MPTEREREYYRMGFEDGMKSMVPEREQWRITDSEKQAPLPRGRRYWENKPKRKVSSWQKFVKANSNKKKFKYASGKLNLKKMGVAYRKTAVYKRNKKK